MTYPYPPPVDATSSRDETSSRGEQLTFVGVCAAVGAVLAVPAAAVWVWVADPPTSPLSRSGVFFAETQLDQQTSVAMWFMLIGLVGGIVPGLVAGWSGQRHGWITVAGILLLCAVAASLTWLLGVHVFGPDEQAQIDDATIGDPITSTMDAGPPVAYLSWPIGGLIGGIAAIFGWRKDQSAPLVAPSSSSVSAGR